MTDTTPAEMRVHADLIADRYNIQDGEAALWRAMVHVVQAARNLADVIEYAEQEADAANVRHWSAREESRFDAMEDVLRIARGETNERDGSTRSGVRLLTGATDEELDEMGGFTNETVAIASSTAQDRRLSDMRAVIDHVLDTHEGVIGTHHEGCYLYHAGCLAVVLREALVWDFRDTGDVSGNDDEEPLRTPQPCAVCGTNGGFSLWHRENRCVNHLRRGDLS